MTPGDRQTTCGVTRGIFWIDISPYVYVWHMCIDIQLYTHIYIWPAGNLLSSQGGDSDPVLSVRLVEGVRAKE